MTFQRSTVSFILGLIILIEVANALLGNLVAAFFQEKLGANLGLVLVPFAVLVAILFGFEMSNRLREHTTKEIRAEPASDRNRAVMLDKVENFWVRGVLNQSLYQIARLELGLEQAPEKIGHPWQRFFSKQLSSLRCRLEHRSSSCSTISTGSCSFLEHRGVGRQHYYWSLPAT